MYFRFSLRCGVAFCCPKDNGHCFVKFAVFIYNLMYNILYNMSFCNFFFRPRTSFRPCQTFRIKLCQISDVVLTGNFIDPGASVVCCTHIHTPSPQSTSATARRVRITLFTADHIVYRTACNLCPLNGYMSAVERPRRFATKTVSRVSCHTPPSI